MYLAPSSHDIEVLSGASGVALVVRINAYPLPEVVWDKDGSILDTNSTKYDLRFVDKLKKNLSQKLKSTGLKKT